MWYRDLEMPMDGGLDTLEGDEYDVVPTVEDDEQPVLTAPPGPARVDVRDEARTSDLTEEDRRIELALLYRDLSRWEIYETVRPGGLEAQVQRELTGFVRSRLRDLMGTAVKPPAPSPVKETPFPFTPEETGALRQLARRLLEQPTLTAPPARTSPTRPVPSRPTATPTVPPVTAVAAPPAKPAPAKPAPATKTSGRRAKPGQAVITKMPQGMKRTPGRNELTALTQTAAAATVGHQMDALNQRGLSAFESPDDPMMKGPSRNE